MPTRKIVRIENGEIVVGVSQEGGHIAEIVEKKSGVNPLWTPPWPSIEPSTFGAETHPEYGHDAESKLLAGILGHNLCLDIFGPPSEDEYAAGVTVHGESSVIEYDISVTGHRMIARAHLPLAQLDFEREMELAPGGVVKIREMVLNLTARDRPLAWTQHVTLGPPFLEPGVTTLKLSATRSKVYETNLSDAQPYQPGAEFMWPLGPAKDGGIIDMSVPSAAPKSAGMTAHLVDPSQEHGTFEAYHAPSRVVFGYRWKRADFPWICLWEENRSRMFPPWNGNAVTRGIEFGASPFAEPRRAMVARGSLFGVPSFRWLGAKESVTVHYSAYARRVD